MIKRIKSWLWWRHFNKHKRKRCLYNSMKVLYITCPYYEEEGTIYYISENDIYQEAFRELSILGFAKPRGTITMQDRSSWELLFNKLENL